MNRLIVFTLVFALGILSSFSLRDIQWKVAEGFNVAFDSQNASGAFGELHGSIQFDPANLEASSFDMSIPVESIATGNWLKNKHARGKKWFNAEEFPYITFVSKTIRRTGESFEVDGILKMHGISQPLTIPFRFEDNSFSSRFTVNRMDFQVGSTKGFASKVPEEIRVSLNVPVLP